MWKSGPDILLKVLLRTSRTIPPTSKSVLPIVSACNHVVFRNLRVSPSCWKSAKALAKEKQAALEEEMRKKKTEKRLIPVWRHMSVQELAVAMNRSIDDVFEIMMYVPNTDSYDSPSSRIDDPKAIVLIVKKLGYRPLLGPPPKSEKDAEAENNKDVESMPVREKELAPRPPVVTIMGHVDHGKTTLLDSLRNSNIVATEAGGITQAIGAFQVKLEGRLVTFIDTPGHAAFHAMRNRGANATDIVVLVVAADDGVMEQTRESISMAKNANVPIIVAINKIDRGDADIERTKTMLLQEGIQLEDFGGDVMAVPVSALKSRNLDGLVEAILTQAELMDLKAESKGAMEGVVIESRVDPGRGRICTSIVQRGVLRKGSILVAGTAWAKVRNLFDESGSLLSQAGPSTPVEIIGWRDLPSAGERINEVESEKRAREVTEYRSHRKLSDKSVQDLTVIQAKNEEWQKQYQAKLALKWSLGLRRMRPDGPRQKENPEEDTGIPRVNLVVKGDVDGSVESLLDVIDSYDCEQQCRLDVVHYGVGDVSESDLKIAETFKAHIYGFNVSMNDKLTAQCIKLGLEFRKSKIIYRLVEALKKDIEAALPPIPVEEVIGEANVLQVFMVTEGKKNKVPVSGSRCIKGTLRKDGIFRLIRGENEVIFDGKVHSIRHLKNEVNSVQKDVECGICLEDFETQPLIGDRIVCYKIGSKPQRTEWEPDGF